MGANPGSPKARHVRIPVEDAEELLGAYDVMAGSLPPEERDEHRARYDYLRKRIEEKTDAQSD